MNVRYRPFLDILAYTVEELLFDDVIILEEDDYSWYDLYGEKDCLCWVSGCAADNNSDNPLPVPEGIAIHDSGGCYIHGPYTVA